MKRRLGAAAAVFALLCAGEARAQEKYALAMFHFNVQYVAGGMVGYWAVPNPGVDIEAPVIEDLIITESLQPVVDLFEKHPNWGVDIEMQGYMLDILAARHPALLDKMRGMAKSGQIDIVSFHYSDQLFIAYPQEDWERSQALAAATFAKHDVPLSKSVFCQEGQAGTALAPAMKERGYQTMVWPKNLWSYQHGDFEAQPLYRFGDVFMVAGSKDVHYQNGGVDIAVTWSFLDDGELLATGDLNPYFPDVFRHKPEEVAKYEAELLGLEAQGYVITTVNKYVEAVKDKVPLAEPPELLDGTWQPKSTDGVLRWLGGRGLWGQNERDNDVRTLGAIAHRELLAAETIANAAGIDAEAALGSAWRLLFLGQVSDASGINPFRGEVEYGIGHFTEALRIARDVIGEAKAAMGSESVVIDPDAMTAAPGAALEESGVPIDPPLALVIDAADRQVSQAWEELGPGRRRVTISAGPGEEPKVSVMFPGAGPDFITTRALADNTPVLFSREDFAFEHFYLALPTGLISLGPNLFVIKDQAWAHVAAKITTANGDVTFVDETVPVQEPMSWVFYLIEGTAEEAVKEARAFNVKRRLAR
ncbi:MAG: hypothetical protein HUU21_23685 [Polyangiaceae bacterium]|nr:hypothetical protein [Polyangiaceae bacterium]